MCESQAKVLRPVTHCIFDNDGTLMDTENLYVAAINNLLRPYGHTYTFELKQRCMGLPTPLATRLLIKELQLPVDDIKFERMFKDEVCQLMGNVKLLPGVEKLVLHLHDHRIPMAIATSAEAKSFRHKASPHCNLMNAFRHIVCGDDPELKRGKPSPDIFLLAASRLRARPESCLVFEDSPIGLQAGLAAGMQVVMIPDPRVPEEKRKGATKVLKSLEDFEPETFGLPPYKNCSRFTFG